MISPSFSSSLPLPLPLFCLLFIMLGTPVSLTTAWFEHEFKNCLNGTFKCGNITAGFPFHGGDREKECGHPDLELHCDQNINTTTMKIHGAGYRVLEIRPDRQILRISREEVINKGNCPSPFSDEDWILDSPVLTPGPGSASVTLFYDCVSPISPDFLSFPCNKNDDFSNVSVAIANNYNIHQEGCSNSVNVSILQTSLERLRKHSSDWKGAWKTGFEVQWRKNYADECWKCTSSDGACGFIYDQAHCYCPPGNWSGLEGKECQLLPPHTVNLENNKNFPTVHRYGTRVKSKIMDQRLEKLEQMQKEMQDQLQRQMKEQLEKIQHDMTQKILESQNDLVTKMTQLLKGVDKGKGSAIINEEENNDEPLYPPGFMPPHMRAQTELPPRKPSVSIRPQQFQGDAPISMNFQPGSGSNPRDNLNNIVVPDFDEAAEKNKVREEFPKQFEEKWKWIEEKLRAIESIDSYHGIDAKDLSLVPDLVLPYKFKMPEFEKYNGTSCPGAHITMFCRRMTGYINNDQLLIHCFQESLTGAASKWYNQLSRTKIATWRDLAQAFMRQYNHVSEIMPDRLTLQNLEKKTSESFRQYAQRWKEVAIQVQPPLLEKEMTTLFINTLKAPFITHMLGSASKSFSEIIMNGEMIEHAIKSGRIDGGEDNRRSIPKKKENEVNHVSTYNKSITVNQPRKVVDSQQGSSKQEFYVKQGTENLQFTPIPMSYKELYQSLFDAGIVAPLYTKPPQPPYPKWHDANAQCEYHAGNTGHSIENCIAFKKVVERLISMGVVKFDDSSSAENSLPNHD